MGAGHIGIQLPICVHLTHTAAARSQDQIPRMQLDETDVAPEPCGVTGPERGIGANGTCVLGWGGARAVGDMGSSRLGAGSLGESPREAEH